MARETEGTGGTGGGATTDLTLAQLVAAEAGAAVGDIARPTDSRHTLVCRSAGVWTYTFDGVDVVRPPSTGWAAMNGGGIATPASGEIVVSVAAAAGVTYRGQIRSLPAAPYFLVVGLQWNSSAGQAGIGLKDSANPQIIMITDALGDSLNYQKNNNFTAFNSNYAVVSNAAPRGVWWWGVVDDGVNREVYYSRDRRTWVRFDPTTVLRTDFITPDQFWVGGYPDTVEADLTINIFDLETGTGALPT